MLRSLIVKERTAPSTGPSRPRRPNIMTTESMILAVLAVSCAVAGVSLLTLSWGARPGTRRARG